MCKSNEGKTLVYHVIHCYPRAIIYISVVCTLILLLAIIERIS